MDFNERIVPNTEWMAQMFKYYNEKYFDGKLETPYFSTNCPKGKNDSDFWGYYQPDEYCDVNYLTRKLLEDPEPGTIYLNGEYERTLKDVISTLLHEMIHMYIITVLRKYPINAHLNKDFKEWVKKLNENGWDITIKTEKKPTDVKIDNNQEGNDEEGDEYINNQQGDNVESTNTQNNNSNDLFYFGVIDQPKDNNNPIWLFRLDIDDLQSYMKIIQHLKTIVGTTGFWIYITKNKNFNKLQMSPSDLSGVGGSSFEDILGKLNCGIKEVKLYKTIKI